jgi:hypothetical protein
MVFSLSIFSCCVPKKPLKDYPDKLCIEQYKLFKYIERLPNSNPSKLSQLHQYIKTEKANVIRANASEETSILPLARQYLKQLIKELDDLNGIMIQKNRVKPQARTKSTSPTCRIVPGDFDPIQSECITTDLAGSSRTSSVSSGSMSP